MKKIKILMNEEAKRIWNAACKTGEDMKTSDEIKNDAFWAVNGCAPLEGVEVKGQGAVGFGSAGGALVEVNVIRRPGVLIGDRPFQVAVEPGTLFVARKCLTASPFPGKMEFASDNPYGEFRFARTVAAGDIELTFQSYKKAIVVEVRDVGEGGKREVLFSRTFYGRLRDSVEAIVNDFATFGEDIGVTISKLEEIK
jgi:hypothetical protein